MDKTNGKLSKTKRGELAFFAETFKFNTMKRILQITVFLSLLSVGTFAQTQHQVLPADQEIPLKYGADRLGKRQDAAAESGMEKYTTELPNG